MTAIDGARGLVTGATGALGGLLARGLAARGARLALSGRDGNRLGALARELGAQAVPADLRDPGAPDAVVARAAERLGGFDVVLQAAGVVAFGPLAELADETLAELVEVNLLAPARLARAAIPRMAEGGVIVQISAIVADMPTAGMAAYSASKAGLSALDRALARELRPRGLRVLDVRPPHLDTGLERRPIAGTAPAMRAGRDPGEVVERIIAAIGDDAAREVDLDQRPAPAS